MIIDKGRIEDAKKAYYKSLSEENPIQRTFETAGFEDGANWTLREFEKRLWKAPLVRPYKGGGIIALSKKGMIYTYTKFFTEIEWKKEWKENNIERWCYLSDILPNKEDKDD